MIKTQTHTHSTHTTWSMDHFSSDARAILCAIIGGWVIHCIIIINNNIICMYMWRLTTENSRLDSMYVWSRVPGPGLSGHTYRFICLIYALRYYPSQTTAKRSILIASCSYTLTTSYMGCEKWLLRQIGCGWTRECSNFRYCQRFSRTENTHQHLAFTR